MLLAAVAIGLFSLQRIPLETSGLAVLMALVVGFQLFPYTGPGGRIDPVEFLSGFGNPALVTVLALLICSKALDVTGALYTIARRLGHFWAQNSRAGLLVTLFGVAVASMFMNNTPLVAMVLPVLVEQTAKLLWFVYAGLTLACIVALLAGMPLFDAINHAFSAMSLGGFSTKDASIGFFDAPAIEAVLIGFMLVAAINFAVHFIALRRSSLRVYAREPEIRWMLMLIIASCFILAAFLLFRDVYDDYWKALRYVSFNLVSVATDCGFVNTNYDQWPLFAPMWMLFLSCVCAMPARPTGVSRCFGRCCW